LAHSNLADTLQRLNKAAKKNIRHIMKTSIK
jgi:hypothetical protein